VSQESIHIMKSDFRTWILKYDNISIQIYLLQMDMVHAFYFVLIIAIFFILLTVISPTPYWPSWLRLLIIGGTNPKLSARSKRTIIVYLFVAALYWPIGILTRLVDSLILSLVSARQKEMRSPIFIIGTPRSGTTLMHRLLIESSNDLFGITHLQWRYPSFLVHWILSATSLGKHLGSRGYWVSDNEADTSTISKMHPNVMSDFEEDAILFEERVCRHLYMFLHVPVSSAYQQYDPHNRKNSNILARIGDMVVNSYYYFTVRCMSFLPHNYGKRFISKEIAELDRLESLKKRYSGCKFIVVSRQPQEFISSLYPLLSLSTKIKTKDSTHLSSSIWWSIWEKWIVEHCKNLSDIHRRYYDDNSFIFIRFEDFTQNPKLMLEKVLSFCSAEKRADFESYISDFQRRQKSRERGYQYDKLNISHLELEGYRRCFYADTANY